MVVKMSSSVFENIRKELTVQMNTGELQPIDFGHLFGTATIVRGGGGH